MQTATNRVYDSKSLKNFIMEKKKKKKTPETPVVIQFKCKHEIILLDT